MSQPSRSDRVVGPPSHRLGLFVVFGLMAGPFLSMVDSNVVTVAIPDIARVFASPLAEVQWAVSGYLLALAGGLAASAYLARRFGALRVYRASLVGFVVASVACAFAPSVGALVIGRAVQGLFGASLVPIAMGMLMGPSSSAGRRIHPAAAILLFLAPAVGPSLGGVMIAGFGWPSVFLINVPFGLIGLAGALRAESSLALPADPAERLDLLGLALLGGGLVAFIYGVSQGPVQGWSSEGVLPFWIGGALLLALYAFWAQHAAHPAVALDLFRDAQAALAVSLCIAASIVLFGMLFLIPVFIQSVQGRTPLEAGLALLPQGLLMAFGTVLGQLVTARGRVREGVIGGMILLALTTAALQLIGLETPVRTTALVLAGRGLALGLIIQPLLVRTLGQLAPSQTADAATLFNVVERASGSLGVALLATFFQGRVESHLAAAMQSLPVGRTQPFTDAGAIGIAQRLASVAQTAGFHDTIWLLTALALAGLFGAMFIARRVGAAALRLEDLEGRVAA